MNHECVELHQNDDNTNDIKEGGNGDGDGDAGDRNSNGDDNDDNDDEDLVLSQFVCVGAGGQESPLES